jgi:hypothetical protein
MMPYQQEESIPSLAADGGWCDAEPPRLKPDVTDYLSKHDICPSLLSIVAR